MGCFLLRYLAQKDKMPSMKHHIITFGCQMNRSDSERIAAVLEKSGHKPVSDIKKADLVVVNMCSVRQSAVDRVYGLTRKLKNKKTILTGCVLNKDKKKLSKEFDYILDIKELGKWPVLSEKEKSNNYLEIKPKDSNNFSANVPIMTGCNNFCAYCVVPCTRGREFSRPTEKIIEEAKSLIGKGYKEVWLLGQNVNAYQQEKTNFPKLLKKINNIPGDFWIRFTSPHPKDFSDELIEIMAQGKKITEYLNLPAQSGDNDILKEMNRPYSIEDYKNLVKKIRRAIPNIAISTDIIVGFPRETKEQFQNTLNLFKEIKYDMAYISRYSPRPQTAALKMEDDVSLEEKRERERTLTCLLEKTALEKNKEYVGKIEKVLISKCSKGFCAGKNRSYKTVKIRSAKRNLTGKFAKVEITEALPWGLKAKIWKN